MRKENSKKTTKKHIKKEPTDFLVKTNEINEITFDQRNKNENSFIDKSSFTEKETPLTEIDR